VTHVVIAAEDCASRNLIKDEVGDEAGDEVGQDVNSDEDGNNGDAVDDEEVITRGKRPSKYLQNRVKNIEAMKLKLAEIKKNPVENLGPKSVPKKDSQQKRAPSEDPVVQESQRNNDKLR
jgi:hypothetical protein